MLSNKIAIAETLEKEELTKHRNEQEALSDDENSSETPKSLMKIVSDPKNGKRMDKEREQEFVSRYIISSNDEIQDELWSNKPENRLKNEKPKEETLEGEHPLMENTEINYERKETKVSKYEKYILISMDRLISVTMIGPLVVGFWRGTWGLMDLHWDMFPFWLCFTFGIATHTTFAFAKHQLYDYVNENKCKSLLERVRCQCLRITYTYTFGVMCNMHWRGGWIILDEYLHINELWIAASLTASFLGALMALRCIRNLLAPPFVVAIDSYSHLFFFPSLCKRVSTN